MQLGKGVVTPKMKFLAHFMTIVFTQSYWRFCMALRPTQQFAVFGKVLFFGGAGLGNSRIC